MVGTSFPLSSRHSSPGHYTCLLCFRVGRRQVDQGNSPTEPLQPAATEEHSALKRAMSFSAGDLPKKLACEELEDCAAVQQQVCDDEHPLLDAWQMQYMFLWTLTFVLDRSPTWYTSLSSSFPRLCPCPWHYCFSSTWLNFNLWPWVLLMTIYTLLFAWSLAIRAIIMILFIRFSSTNELWPLTLGTFIHTLGLSPSPSAC